MNIVLATGIYPPEIGGPATYVRALAAYLQSPENRVTVVTYGKEAVADTWPVKTISRTGGPLIRYAQYVWAVFTLARHADLVYLQGPVSEGFPGAMAARLAGCPIALKVVGDYAWEAYQRDGGTELLDAFVKRSHGGAIGMIERVERWVAKQAKRIIVPSRYLKSVVEAWGVPSEKISVIYNTVEPLPVVGDRVALRAAFGIADQKIILTAVRALPWKGVDFLMDLWRDLPPQTMLCVAGDGPMLETWKRQAETLGLGDRVRFLGRLEREAMTKWYAAADAFVLASGYEGFPHVVVEAASMGLPCFVSDRGGNPETKELFPDYVRVLPYRDANAWTEALRQIPARLAPMPVEPFADVAEKTVNVLKLCAS